MGGERLPGLIHAAGRDADRSTPRATAAVCRERRRCASAHVTTRSAVVDVEAQAVGAVAKQGEQPTGAAFERRRRRPVNPVEGDIEPREQVERANFDGALVAAPSKPYRCVSRSARSVAKRAVSLPRLAARASQLKMNTRATIPRDFGAVAASAARPTGTAASRSMDESRAARDDRRRTRAPVPLLRLARPSTIRRTQQARSAALRGRGAADPSRRPSLRKRPEVTGSQDVDKMRERGADGVLHAESLARPRARGYTLP